MTIQTLELLEDLRALSDDDLGTAFVERTRDEDFARIGGALISPNAPDHWKVWSGFDLVRGNRYAVR